MTLEDARDHATAMRLARDKYQMDSHPISVRDPNYDLIPKLLHMMAIGYDRLADAKREESHSGG